MRMMALRNLPSKDFEFQEYTDKNGRTAYRVIYTPTGDTINVEVQGNESKDCTKERGMVLMSSRIQKEQAQAEA